jgi:hypothetical protein
MANQDNLVVLLADCGIERVGPIIATWRGPVGLLDADEFLVLSLPMRLPAIRSGAVETG